MSEVAVQFVADAPQQKSIGKKLSSWLPLTLVLLLVSVILTHKIKKGEFSLNSDETFHAVTGFYFADVFHDLPVTHLEQYTYRYYAHYPALGLVHWPPFFHIVEGILFSLFGESAVVARLAVLLFALVGVGYWFEIVSDLQGRTAAVVSALLLALLPSVLLYEKSVMLEIPALSLCIAASYYWIRYLKYDDTFALHGFAVASSLALLTKQHSIYLVVFCFLTILVQRKWKLLLSGPMLRAFALCCFLVVPFYTLALAFHHSTIAGDVFQGTIHSNPYMYYPFLLPKQLGLAVFVMAAIGMLTARWWADRRDVLLMGMWILACYVTFTLIAQKDSRYILFWLPPFLYFAVGPFTCAKIPARLRPLSAVTMIAILALQVSSAWSFQRPYVSGYESLARRVMDSGNPGIILYDASLPANFIFYMRAFDPGKHSITLRKSLYATRIMIEYGNVELLHSRADLEKLIFGYGIKYVVVDNGPVDFPIQNTLRDLLKTGDFRLVTEIPVESNMQSWQGRSLFLYEANHTEPVSVGELHLKMMTLNKDIVLPLKDLEIR